jgi:two-component system chemotaxis response regulator CheY
MKKIIFVDDSKTVLTSVKFAVEDLIEKEITFKAYNNPEELLEDVKSEKVKYDLLFVDINMPQMTGLELVEKINNEEGLRKKNGKIVALTTENSKEIKIKGKELGITGWIVKPFNNERIIMTIKKVLKI